MNKKDVIDSGFRDLRGMLFVILFVIGVFISVLWLIGLAWEGIFG